MSATQQSDRAAAGAHRSALPVTILPGGAMCRGAGGVNRTCSLADLHLLEHLARHGLDGVDQAMASIAERLGAPLDGLRTFLGELEGRHLTWPMPAPAGEVGPDPARPVDEMPSHVVLPTPLILGAGAAGFEERDHADRLRLTLTADELNALLAFVRPTTPADAYQHHVEQAGAHALDQATFDALAQRVWAAGAFRLFDPEDPDAGRGFNKIGQAIRIEHQGRKAVETELSASMAELDRLETERREATGQARTRVYPVHAIATAWRNPPLSLGYILAYAQTHNDGALNEHYDFRPDWLISNEKIDANADEPSVYLFSNYIWSTLPNLALSARAKEKNPWNVTIHGGPDVPKYERDAKRYFQDNPHVDITVRGEGEITAASILEALAGQVGKGPVDLSVLKDVPGLTYRDGDGIVMTAERDRMTELDQVPSPYLSGLFDSYASAWRKVANQGIGGTDGWSFSLPVVCVETNRGCPYSCAFCDWGSATMSRIRQFSLDRVFAELDWCAANQVDTIGLADANFGMLKRDVEITARVASLKTSEGFPRQFGTNYAKNTVTHLRQIVDTLASAEILTFGLLSLQSMDSETLLTINRSNIKVAKYEELAREFQRARLPLYVDLMVGLPGQTKRSFRNDMQQCINREVHAKIFPTQLLVNSPMNDPEYREANGIVAQPGEMVVETASFSRDDYQDMLWIRRVFYTYEKFGVLRYVSRFVRHRTGQREIDFFDRLIELTSQQPGRWPTIEFSLVDLPDQMVAPVSWQQMLGELRDLMVTELGIDDDDALDSVLAVQLAVLPSRGRQFPETIQLAHDVSAWHEAMMEAKHEGHLEDWEAVTPDLRTFGPATFTVDDPLDRCGTQIGVSVDRNPWDAWDLLSPISRPVALQG